jgi:N-acetylglucosaminyldiphosphoundecaprenol N-acetyl-beta-D-mannosaminyltransferase
MKDPLQVTHNSSKEERDYILEYQSIDVKERPKLQLSGVEFDNISRDKAVAIIIDLIKKKERFHHILFLDPLKLMYVKPGKPMHRTVKKASMVLADGGGLDWAAEKINQKIKETVTIISLMMDLIRYSEKQGLTLFFLGNTEKTVDKLFFNLVKHFPEIRIVGRHSGDLTRERELMVKEAIRKTSPDIIFLGMEFPKQEVWIENNTGYFGKSIIIGAWSGSFDVLAGNMESAPEYFHKNNLLWLWKVIKKPWKLSNLRCTIRFYLSYIWSGWKLRKNAPES